MNPAAYQALRTMMAKGASKHQSQLSRAMENLIAAFDASPPPGWRSTVPYFDLREVRAVVRGQVLRDIGRAANAQLAVASIIGTSNPEFAIRRTPREWLEAAVEQGELRQWVDLLVRVGPETVLAEHDRRMDALVLPDGNAIVHHGSMRWVLARLTAAEGTFACVQCQCTADDTRASNALALYQQKHPQMKLTRTEAVNAPAQRFQFRGGEGELDVLSRDELIARAGRLRSFFRVKSADDGKNA
ncbi:MAG TPA: hypothetical protein VHE37_17055 [Nevskiaceae bacterium]|nr:hypothetical protein [Nevskiaceae bacterium]